MLVHDGLEAGWHAMWRPLFGHNADERTVAAAATWAGEQRLDDIVAGVRAFHDRRDLRSFANDWNGPIVVISGDQDRTPAPSAARLHGRRRRFHLVDDCGHYCG